MLSFYRRLHFGVSCFRRDRKGVAAVEFALIAPLMLALYMATVEFQEYFTMDRKLTAMTSAAADVVSQDDVVTATEMNDIFTAISSMMSPFNIAAIKLRITRVDIDSSGNVSVCWSRGKNYTGRAKGSSFPLPANLTVNNMSYIVAESQYSYKAIVGQYLPSGITLDRIFYVNPRYVDQVVREGVSCP